MFKLSFSSDFEKQIEKVAGKAILKDFKNKKGDLYSRYIEDISKERNIPVDSIELSNCSLSQDNKVHCDVTTKY